MVLLSFFTVYTCVNCVNFSRDDLKFKRTDTIKLYGIESTPLIGGQLLISGGFFHVFTFPFTKFGARIECIIIYYSTREFVHINIS